MENVVLLIQKNQDQNFIKLKNKDIQLQLFEIENWNEELSPWTFNEFGNGANETLKKLQSQYDLKDTILVGYSLAGLFCLWASFQCEIKGIGCCSGSLWFENFIEYMNKPCLAHKVYFSLGKKESKTRHPYMSLVLEKTELAYQMIQNQNIPCIFELNNGNHFFEVNQRIIKAIQWLTKDEEEMI